jgi:putative oxidoreductase
MLLLVGLWTPVVGAIAALVGIWSVIGLHSDPWAAGVLAALAASVALIGPGAWSIDAQLFGRKHMDIPRR